MKNTIRMAITAFSLVFAAVTANTSDSISHQASAHRGALPTRGAL